MKNLIRRLFFRLGFTPVRIDIEGQPFVAQYLSPEERQLIEQYQLYMAQGMQKGGTVGGGCGGCPSAGECGPEIV